ncbi:MAG: PTS IIA-like nitrogen regulatory protein PtsN [Alphaproteobacteria bacterium]|nr:PTS IIA-like nitrogen regulatory protein PtsN [Alphaproteobacteria bacterium]
MDLSDLVRPTTVVGGLKVSSKKQVLQDLSERVARETGVEARRIFEVLNERERLGSTGVGHGVAIPHGKLAELDRLHGFFARLDRPVDFDAIDDEPVDLVFVLLVPDNAGAEHLKALARVSRLFRSREMRDRLRTAETSEALYALLVEPLASHAA